jgi:hypothetical protein
MRKSPKALVEYLTNRGGRALDTRPKFRLVWSNDTERRHGTYKDFYGPIFLREVTEWREVRRYNYIDDRWILETLEFGDSPELGTRSSYEPLFVFQTSDKTPIEPTRELIAAVLYALENPEKASQLTEDEFWNRKYLKMLESLDTTPFDGALERGEAVSFGGVHEYVHAS